jgi:hypothetical protein
MAAMVSLLTAPVPPSSVRAGPMGVYTRQLGGTESAILQFYPSKGYAEWRLALSNTEHGTEETVARGKVSNKVFSNNLDPTRAANWAVVKRDKTGKNAVFVRAPRLRLTLGRAGYGRWTAEEVEKRKHNRTSIIPPNPPRNLNPDDFDADGASKKIFRFGSKGIKFSMTNPNLDSDTTPNTDSQSPAPRPSPKVPRPSAPSPNAPSPSKDEM